VTTTATTWLDRAACAGVDSAVFYPEAGGTARRARRICAACPVRIDCLQYALDVENDSLRGRHGVWGGLTALERVKLARK
jgi:WhiB family redox-sensing transcriptional regulator